MLKSDPRALRGAEEVDELEERIENLKHDYDMFFAGITNIDPTEKKAPIRRIISRMHEHTIPSPRLRFRFQTLLGRFVSLNQYWTRTMKEIEEGRFHRDIFRSRIVKPEKTKAFFGRHAPQFGNEEDERDNVNVDPSAVAPAPQERERAKQDSVEPVDISAKDVISAMTSLDKELPESFASATPRPARPVPNMNKPELKEPSSASRSEIDDKKMDHLFDEFVAARKRVNAPVDGLKKDTMRRQLERQAIELKEKFKGSAVDFRVVEKDGKVLLRPVVKKTSG